MTEVYTPRLSIEITEDQNKKLQKFFPHGTKKIVFGQIIEQILALIDKYGAGTVLGAFMDRQMSIEKMMCMKIGTIGEDEDGDDR